MKIEEILFFESLTRIEASRNLKKIVTNHPITASAPKWEKGRFLAPFPW
jgi:hypothetical protein